MKALILTLQFLTRLPLPFMIEGGPDLFAKGMKYFPAAGLLIGGLDLGLAALLMLVFPADITAMLVVLFDLYLTGGLHMDGLADTADALGSHRNKERMLEIMKDSRIGTFGVLAVIAVLLIRMGMYRQILLSVEGSWMRWGMLAGIPVVSRMVMAVLIYISEYARKEGMGGLFFSYKESMNLPVTVLLGILFAGCAGYYGIALLVIGILTGLIVRGYCYKKIDGMTGDTLGAALVITETVLAICGAVMVRFMIF